MFKVGDFVRVIPPSYIDAAKNFFLYRDCWEKSNINVDTRLMLGGKYKIISHAKKSGDDWYSLLNFDANNQNKILGSFLIGEYDFSKCPFRKGDKLIFSPVCSDSDRTYLAALEKIYSLSKNDAIFEVKDILNEYYVFLNYEKNSDYAYPFRWKDFKKK